MALLQPFTAIRDQIADFLGKLRETLFPELRKLRGDRELEDSRGLDALRESNAQWDWVVDTWQKSPKCVLDSTRVLKGFGDAGVSNCQL